MTTPKLLQGKTVLVTGAGAGVGLGIAVAMGAAGANVIVAARRASNGESAAQAVQATGAKARFVLCDVASREDIQQAVDAALASWDDLGNGLELAAGRLDCVVHNALAPVGPPAQVQATEAEIWENMRSTALRASFNCAQLAYPHLRKSQGAFVLLSSSVGVEGSAHLPLYATVKAAQRAFAKSLALEWGPDNIRVNLINPVALTPAMDRAYDANPTLKVALEASTPLGRVGDPTKDVGPVAVFLASDMSRYITGQTITVDGGSFRGL